MNFIDKSGVAFDWGNNTFWIKYTVFNMCAGAK